MKWFDKITTMKKDIVKNHAMNYRVNKEKFYNILKIHDIYI